MIFCEWENFLDIFYSHMFSTYDRNWKEIKPEAREKNFVSDLNKKGSEKNGSSLIFIIKGNWNEPYEILSCKISLDYFLKLA